MLSDPDFMAWTPAERGIWITLSARCWADGSIPENPDRMAKLCGCSAQEMREHWSSISTKFSQHPIVGRLISNRIEEERQIAIAKAEKIRGRAQAGAAARWLKDKEELPKQSPSNAEAKPKQKQRVSVHANADLWFEAIWDEVWPDKVVQDGAVITVDPGRKAPARDRFRLHCKTYAPVALYLSARSYIKQDRKVLDGYVQEVSTFFGTKKGTYKDYLEVVLPYLERHPALAALKEPPASEEALKAAIAQDEAPHE
jgi:uncharacterized protein YdaU (DUF1376 family)